MRIQTRTRESRTLRDSGQSRLTQGHAVRLIRPAMAYLLVSLSIAGCGTSGATNNTGEPNKQGQPTVAPPTSYAPSGIFTPTGSMNTGREDGLAITLPDGRVLILGGKDSHGATVPLDRTEAYDPSTKSFGKPDSIPTIPDSSATGPEYSAVSLADGRVLIITSLGSAYLYDPSTGAVRATGSMTTGRRLETATLLSDGRVLVAGGVAGPDTATAELYDPVTGTFRSTGSMTTPREDGIAVLLGDGRVLVVGGVPVLPGDASAELYDPKTGTFSATGSMTYAPIYTINGGYPSATLLRDGRVLIAGGEVHLSGPSNLGATALADLYDPKSGTFSATGPMTASRGGQTATLLDDGRVLIAGGAGDASVGFQPQSSAELYDPKTGTFSVTGSMTSVRERATATRLMNGSVLIAGGSDGSDNSGYSDSAELYQP
jgi:hypothetical protein